jgi:hypothetical protein
MLKKISLIFTLIVFLSGCGYSPMFSKKNGQNLNIEITNYEGDSKLNSVIRSRFKIYSDEKARLFKIKINTSYQKNDLSKNTAGVIDKYQLSAVSIFDISSGDFNKTITLTEEISMVNFEDNFEEKNYENKIKEDFATSISKRLIIQLLKIK